MADKVFGDKLGPGRKQTCTTTTAVVVWIEIPMLQWLDCYSSEHPGTVIMREMAPIGEMAPGWGKRSKKNYRTPIGEMAPGAISTM